jgi:hypothetical protein
VLEFGNLEGNMSIITIRFYRIGWGLFILEFIATLVGS